MRIFALLLTLGLLAGCGSAPFTSSSAAPQCEVQRFAGPQWVLEPPVAVRTFRSAYGFGGYAQLVYPELAGCPLSFRPAGPSWGAYARFQSDPAVIAAAQDYARCLKRRGYQVGAVEPGLVEQSMASAAIGRFASSGVIDAMAARSALAGEIKAALDDLDCGSAYATLVRGNWANVVREAGR